jgi:hypothetical protein
MQRRESEVIAYSMRIDQQAEGEGILRHEKPLNINQLYHTQSSTILYSYQRVKYLNPFTQPPKNKNSAPVPKSPLTSHISHLTSQLSKPTQLPPLNIHLKNKKTYNSGDSPVVTHLTTSPPIHCLTRAERTGSRDLNVLWSYVVNWAE